MAISESLFAQKELGVLAEKLILYRYKIYSAAIMALTSLSAILIYVGFLLLEYIGPLILTLFAVPFIVSIVVGAAFKKTLASLKTIALRRGRRIEVKRINTVVVLAYSVPFIALYSVSPLPYWPTYAWYLAIIGSNAVMYLFFERYINENTVENLVNVYKWWTTIALATLPMEFYAISTLPLLAPTISVMLYIVTSVIASIRELYSAERML